MQDVGRAEPGWDRFEKFYRRGGSTDETILAYARNMNSEFNSSMARDLEAGKPLEIESITGAVVRHGLEAGVPTPANRAMLDVLLPLHQQALAARG